MKSDILVTLIKEVVKNEVRQQVKEEIIKLIKSGTISLNNESKKTTPTLSELTNMKPVTKKQVVTPKQPVRQITKDPMLNEILNSTEPFTSAHRAETGMSGVSDMSGGGSILDALQPSVSMEGDWETMDYRATNVPDMPIPISDNPAVDSLAKALTRDYTELVKRFK